MDKETLYSFFQEKKLRLTQARRGLIEVLADSPAPLSAPEISRRLKRACVAVDKTTVYRELERWENLGLLAKFRLRDEEVSYELRRGHHHHVICVKCEDVVDITLPEVEIQKAEIRIIQETQFQKLRHSLEFFGLCKQCQS